MAARFDLICLEVVWEITSDSSYGSSKTTILTGIHCRLGNEII